MKTRPSIFLPAPLIPLLLLTLSLLLTGCVGVMPFPEFSNQPIHGTRLRDQDTAFIDVGTTSAAEVFTTLGSACACDARQRAVAYSWELPGGRGVLWAVGAYGGGGMEFDWSRWRAFFVAFDTNNVVIAAASKRLSGNKPLHTHLDAWAKKQGAAPGQMHPELFATNEP